MKLIIFTLLLLCTSAHTVKGTLKGVNSTYLKGPSISVDEVEFVEIEKGLYIAKGSVSYSDWPTCSSDVREKDLNLVCIASDEEIFPYYFAQLYPYGKSVQCSGNKIDETFPYPIKEPKWFGCGVTNGDYVMYVIYDLYGLAWWAIVLIVIAVLICVSICGCLIFYFYRKRKQPQPGIKVPYM